MNEGLDINKKKNLEAQEADLVRRGLDDIRARLKNIPEKQQEKELKKILEEYGINKYELDWRDEDEKNKKKDSVLKTARKATMVIGAALGLVALKGIWDSNKSKKDKVVPETEQSQQKTEVKEEEENPIEINPRFKIEVYNSLSREGKDVYAYFANYNPTPGRGYMMLDKRSATQYVFNDKNEIIAKLVAGFGKDIGDEQNTSYSYNTGKMTTPAGAYIVSNASKESDTKTYGPMQYSLFGISTKGEKVYLGIHKTYPGDLNSRTDKLNTPEVTDNRFSDGCVNIDEKNFENSIKPYFQGDGGEIMIILPDEGSTDEFRIDVLAKKALELVVDVADQQERQLNARLKQINSEQDFIAIKAELERVRIKRARAQKILEGR